MYIMNKNIIRNKLLIYYSKFFIFQRKMINFIFIRNGSIIFFFIDFGSTIFLNCNTVVQSEYDYSNLSKF